MSAPCYIGDEASAAAFRLAGARVIVPRAGEEARAFAEACSEVPLLLVSAAVAVRIAVHEIDAAQASLAPLVLIVPDLREQAALPDLTARLRAQLGLEAP